MFECILVANRGEIACRVMRTARALGVRTVAVYSDVDADAMHVQMADAAVRLGGATPAESYLRGEAIIEAALATGAQAIHPGYGFFSENPAFVEAVEAAGLVFIGPSAQAIRAMGLKGAAKALMEAADVPVVPGYHGDDQDEGHLEVEAARIGFPVLIKAVAGGGGKGMRPVERAEDFADALSAAKSEARGAFGNDAVLIEKLIATPRHIEVQVFGDGTEAVHLFERDCSLQRRHQKVIEEAPAPGMTPEMRDAMCGAAVRAAKAVGYAGAGTVEFIVDAGDGLDPDGFYFMEMNTRLQVEHPVTEAVTGVDLVEWQLRVAAGEPIPLAQDRITLTGHAFEARLYAEDVPAGFLPATGTLSHLAFPPEARADTGVRAGDTISPYYDPMIAKVIVHGATRAAALGRFRAALSGTQVAGCVTNHAFLRKLARDPGFVAGRVDTGLIGRGGPDLVAAPVPCSRSRAFAALGALGLDRDLPPFAGFTLWGGGAQRAVVHWGEEEIEISVRTLGPGQFETRVGDVTHLVERRGGSWWVDDAPTPVQIHRAGDAVTVFFGNGYVFTVPDPLASGQGEAGGDGVLRAPMPGLVKSVFVKAGQEVVAGAKLAVLEAMKMEHTLRAPVAARVAEVLVAEGAQVEAGAVLITLAPEEERDP